MDIIFNKSYFICIDTNLKEYTINFNINNIKTFETDWTFLTDDNEILKRIGVNVSIEEQREKLYNSYFFNLTDSLDEFIKTLTNTNKNSAKTSDTRKSNINTKLNQKELNDLNEKLFKEAIQPGFIAELEINNQRHLGIILTSNTIIYINDKGEIKGYINNFTKDDPYKINCIVSPTKEFFKLKDYNSMPVIWKRKKPATIKKSIKEIEKDLGLQPGTLEIC